MIGEAINKLIELNIGIFAEATKIKDINGKLRENTNLSTKERVEIALKIRELNNERSSVRWEIDEPLGMGANETKIFSRKKKEC